MKKKLMVMILALGMLTGCAKEIPKLADGKEALIEFKDGSKFSVDEIWKEVKETYAMDITLNKIDKKILESEYKDKEKDVEEYISNTETSLKTNYVDESGKYSEEKLLESLQQYGYNSIEQFLEAQKLSYLTNLAVTDFAKGKLTSKQINDYYKNEAVGDIKCVHILVKPNSTSTDDDKKAKENAEKVIADIKKDIENGTKALDAFKKYKKDDSVTYQDLGYFNKGDMVSEFEEAAYKLKKGEYSTSPVKTTHGYHVILKLDEKEKGSFEDIQEDIKDTLAEEMIEKDSKLEVNAMIELRKKHGIKWHDSIMEDAYNKYMNYLINKSDN